MNGLKLIEEEIKLNKIRLNHLLMSIQSFSLNGINPNRIVPFYSGFAFNTSSITVRGNASFEGMNFGLCHSQSTKTKSKESKKL